MLFLKDIILEDFLIKTINKMFNDHSSMQMPSPDYDPLMIALRITLIISLLLAFARIIF